MDSSQFAEILRNAASEDESKPSDKEVNPITGYTKDWQKISEKVRNEHNWTCEKCGIHVSPYDHSFMEVHHKNRIKTDNRESNLQCLCIKCHSEVDPIHIHNFSTPNKRLLIKLFMEKYGHLRQTISR